MRAVGARDTANTHVMTTTEWIVMEGIAGNPQSPVRTKSIAQTKVEMEGWVGKVSAHVYKIR